MRAMSSPTSLFLAPCDPLAAPAPGEATATLAELAVIGEPLGPARFAAGAGFSRHVVYAGCSPHLVMEPPEDGSLAFCHVALHGPYPAPRLVTGPNTVRPRCPACRSRFDDWRDQVSAWTACDTEVACRRCGTHSPLHALDWRGHALCGRVLIELRNVFPGEASPSDQLLGELERRTGVAWRYAWAGCLLD